MNALRISIVAILFFLLVGGGTASVWFWSMGKASDWALLIDQPSIVSVAMLVFVACIVFAFLPVNNDEAPK